MQLSWVAAVGALTLGAGAYGSWRRGKVRQLLAVPATEEADPGDLRCGPESAAAVVLIGDSRMSRWLPAPTLPAGVGVLNRGRGGETLAAMTARFEREALRCRPRAIVLQSGVNDLVAASFMSGDEAAAVVRATLERFERLAAQASGVGVTMLAMSIVPPGRPTLAYRVEGVGRLVDLVAAVNDALSRVRWPSGVRLLDPREALCADGGRTLRREFQDDTLHMNEAAYVSLNRLLGEALAATLASRIFSIDTQA